MINICSSIRNSELYSTTGFDCRELTHGYKAATNYIISGVLHGAWRISREPLLNSSLIIFTCCCRHKNIRLYKRCKTLTHTHTHPQIDASTQSPLSNAKIETKKKTACWCNPPFNKITPYPCITPTPNFIKIRQSVLNLNHAADTRTSSARMSLSRAYRTQNSQ